MQEMPSHVDTPDRNVQPCSSFQPDQSILSSVSPTPDVQHRHVSHGGHVSAGVSQVVETGGLSRSSVEDRSDDTRGPVQTEDFLRHSQDRSAVSGSVQRFSMDGLVHQDLREEHQARASTVCSVCDQKAGCGDQSRAHQGLPPSSPVSAGGSSPPSPRRCGIRSQNRHSSRTSICPGSTSSNRWKIKWPT